MKLKYIARTWQRGRYFEFSLAYIVSEMIKGYSQEYNTITEI